MTAPVAPALTAETSQAAQAAVAAEAVDLIASVWPSLDVGDLSRSMPAFRRLVAAIVARLGGASSAAAVTYYRAERIAAGLEGGYVPRPSRPAGSVQVGRSIDWATAPLWSAEPDTAAALKRTQSTTERLVLNAGRQTVMDNVRKDKQAKEWARIAEPDACFWCAMMAIRKGAYTSYDAANFHAHDDCRCHVMPVFHSYQPSERVTQWNALWSKSTRGKSGPDAIKAFRQAYEGRPVT